MEHATDGSWRKSDLAVPAWSFDSQGPGLASVGAPSQFPTETSQMSLYGSALLRAALLVSAALAAPWPAMPAPTGAVAEAASSTPPVSRFDQRLVRDINHARASRGIRRLTLVAGTTDVAHRWSCHMARYRVLRHNPNLAAQLSTHGSDGWTTYGENIGWQSSGYGADRLFRSYMREPYHRANILNRSFRYVGIWSKRGGRRRWNTTDFVGAPVSSYSYAYGGTRVSC